jgi:hypothetical protein
MKDLQEKAMQYCSKMDADMAKIRGDIEALNKETEVQNKELKEFKEALKDLAGSVQQQKNEQKDMVKEDSLWSTIVNKHVEKKFEMVKG